MNNLRVFEQLDFVLFLIKDKEFNNTIITIRRVIREQKKEISNDELTGMLLQIQHDGYVFVRRFTEIEQFVISTQGLMFDGYVAKAMTDANDFQLKHAEIDRLRTFDERAEQNQVRLNRLTLWLAIGTVVLAAMEIIKFLCEMDSSIKVLFERII